MKKLNKWATGTLIGVIIIGVVGNYFYDQMKSDFFIGWLFWFGHLLYDTTATILNAQIKIWVLLLVIGAIFLFRRLYLNYQNNKVPSYVRNYTKDKFHHWTWR
jgi:undecaprenyl pyrophosphate phosphatase UppP